jgi:hypothetical protein
MFALEAMLREKPNEYVRAVLSVLPRELTIESITSDLSDEQIDTLIEKIRDHLLSARQSEKEIEISDAVH